MLFFCWFTALQAQSGFITTWITTTDNESITIPIHKPTPGYNYTVDWGDENKSSGHTGDATHTYVKPGTYDVKITGDFPRIYFNNNGDRLKIRSIKHWGFQVWTSMGYAFSGCENLEGNADDIPNLSNVTDTRAMFNAAARFNQDINDWDVSGVRDMRYMFSVASRFNQPLGNWNVLNVDNMDSMFLGATNFNQDLGSWNVSNVKNMTNIFKDATLSNENYEALLEHWSKRSLQDGIQFNGGHSKYCEESGRQKLISDFKWSITDGGQDCDLSSPDVLTETFKVYPIPTSGSITINVDANVEQLTLYNLQGVEVQSKAQEYSKTINLSGLSSGTYVLKVQTNKGVIIRRIVKE